MNPSSGFCNPVINISMGDRRSQRLRVASTSPVRHEYEGGAIRGVVRDKLIRMLFPPALGVSKYAEPSSKRIREWQQYQIMNGISNNEENLLAEEHLERSAAATRASAAAAAPPTLAEEAIQMAINEHGLQRPRPQWRQRISCIVATEVEDDDDDETEYEFRPPRLLHAPSSSSRDADDSQSLPVAENTDDNGNVGLDDGAVIELEPPKVVENNCEHSQFMEAAVAVAIQKKGLSTTAPADEVEVIANDSE